jgi:hypothetical protein
MWGKTNNFEFARITCETTWWLKLANCVATPLLEECEDDTHTPKMGTWDSIGTPFGLPKI